MGIHSLSIIIFATSIARIHGHGAVLTPYPRNGKDYCAWCVGEHLTANGKYGEVNRAARPSSPCMGTDRNTPPYTSSNTGGGHSECEGTVDSYPSGGSFESKIVLNADHNGDAIWSYCPHSEAETEECFQQHPLTQWEDVHSTWGNCNKGHGACPCDHWKTGSCFSQTVPLPKFTGKVTLRWLWMCKCTDEVFVSCIDVDIQGSGPGPSGPGPSGPGPATPYPPTLAPPGTGTGNQYGDCVWTIPEGTPVTKTSRNKKNGRICWDFSTKPGTEVFYQAKVDIYHVWNAEACCLRAGTPYGSATGSNPNIVRFVATQATGGNFGFCECTAWDPDSPGQSCAGQATESNMICPVEGTTKAMCKTTDPLGSEGDNLYKVCGGGVTPPPGGGVTSPPGGGVTSPPGGGTQPCDPNCKDTLAGECNCQQHNQWWNMCQSASSLNIGFWLQNCRETCGICKPCGQPGDCVITDCGCDWATAETCGDDDGSKCNKECCCKFRSTTVTPAPTGPPPTGGPTAPPSPPPAGTPVETHGQLTVQGNKIKDKNGQNVRLRGMSLFWSMWGEGSKYYNEAVVKELAQVWKVSLVRCAMGISEGGLGYQHAPAKEKGKVKAVVDAAIKYGIYVIIDWHDHHAEKHIDGANGALTFFREMATTYGNTPNVLFETFNEPVHQDWGSVIKPYHERLVAEIRKHSQNLILLGTKKWCQELDEASSNMVAGSNLALVLHFYASTHKQSLRNNAEAALGRDVALFVTEWGTCSADGNGHLNLGEAQQWMGWLGDHHISDANWAIGDKNEKCAALKPGASITGGWTGSDLTDSGNWVKASILGVSSPGPGPGPSTGGGCVITDCGCDWATAETCGDDDGSKCNKECCCKFRQGSSKPGCGPTDCGCSWASPQTCGHDDGTKCNRECCCTFRSSSFVAFNSSTQEITRKHHMRHSDANPSKYRDAISSGASTRPLHHKIMRSSSKPTSGLLDAISDAKMRPATKAKTIRRTKGKKRVYAEVVSHGDIEMTDF